MDYPTSGTSNFMSVFLLQIQYNGMAVGYNGIILRTTDGGNNWISQSSGTNMDCMMSLLQMKIYGTAVGHMEEFCEQQMVVITGFYNQAEQSVELSQSLLQIQLTGTVVGTHGTIFRTIDGGTNWISQSSLSTRPC